MYKINGFQTSQIIQVKGSFGGGARSFAPRVSVPRVSVSPRVIVEPRVSAPRISTPVTRVASRVSQPAPRTVINNYHSGYGYGYHPYYSYYGVHPGYYYMYHPGYWFSYNFWNYMWFSSMVNQQQVYAQQSVQQQFVNPQAMQAIQQSMQEPIQTPSDDGSTVIGWILGAAIVGALVWWWVKK